MSNLKALIALAASLLMITAVLLFGSTQANAQTLDPHTSHSLKNEIVIGDIYIVHYNSTHCLLLDGDASYIINHNDLGKAISVSLTTEDEMCFATLGEAYCAFYDPSTDLYHFWGSKAKTKGKIISKITEFLVFTWHNNMTPSLYGQF